MKTIAETLTDEYLKLNPGENDIDTRVKDTGLPKKHFLLDLQRIFWNWIDNLRVNPNRALATTNWCGKVTKAFFASYSMKTPSTKAEMVRQAKILLRPVQFSELSSMMQCGAFVTIAGKCDMIQKIERVSDSFQITFHSGEVVTWEDS